MQPRKVNQLIKAKKIKRKPGQKSAMYFSADTEKSISSFLNSESQLAKEKIYKDEIQPAVSKLLESLIFVYGFKSPTASTSELIDEGTFFLYSVLHKWNPDAGSKAFSYFNVVAKNFLINTTNGHRKKHFKHVYLDDSTSLSNDIVRQIENQTEIQSTEDVIIYEERNTQKLNRIKKIKEKLHNQNDIIAINAVENLFESVKDIDFINKQSIYVYLMEISGLDKKMLSKSMNKIRKLYATIATNEVENESW